jgi:hypothetical protein
LFFDRAMLGFGTPHFSGAMHGGDGFGNDDGDGD